MEETDAAKNAVSRGYELTTVKHPLPSLFYPLFRNQGGVNRAILKALEEVVAGQERLEESNRSLAESVSAENQRLNSQIESNQHEFRHYKISVEARISAMCARVAELSMAREATTAKLVALQEEIEKIKIGGEAFDTRLSDLVEALDLTRREGEKFKDQVGEAVEILLASAGNILSKTKSIDANTSTGTDIRDAEEVSERDNPIFAAFEQFAIAVETGINNLIALTESRTAFARRPKPTKESGGKVLALNSTIEAKEFDRFYNSFEERFRGSRDSVADKQKRHLDIVIKAHEKSTNKSDFRVIDLGCGRGEWLQLLKESNIDAIGIDENADFVSICESRGLSVKDQDIVTYLGQQPDDSCGAISAFHVVEHLSFPVLWTLFKETIRVLAPGGVAIFETPNPSNLRVAAHYFLTDVTHVRPIPPTLAAFLAEFHGASKVETQEYHPFPENKKYNDLPHEINDAIYGPQDYSVVIWK